MTTMALAEGRPLSWPAQVWRGTRYALGLATLSFGIVVTTRAGLGVSPINSLPFVLSVVTPLSLGTGTLLMHLAQIAAQVALLRRRTTLKVWLQLANALLFAQLIDLVNGHLVLQATGYATGAAILALGIFATAAGTFLIVGADLVNSPPDGLVKAIAGQTKAAFGTVKIIHDSALVAVTATIGLAAAHWLVGLGPGTIAAAFLVGYLTKLFAHLPARYFGRPN
ncbi:MAG: DUF6198 family protein [Propionibacteriaceae bacterium]|jgi:uncharacterized membrane protein YczE|nr:DUF6198 family protein [Propionibacteriaceae bacterium]